MRKFIRRLTLVLALLPMAGWAAELININTADVPTLEQVKGIGPSKAQAIVDYRKTNGPFASVDDLAKVHGFGQKSIAKIKPQVTAGTAAVSTAAPAKTAAKK